MKTKLWKKRFEIGILMGIMASVAGTYCFLMGEKVWTSFCLFPFALSFFLLTNREEK